MRFVLAFLISVSPALTAAQDVLAPPPGATTVNYLQPSGTGTFAPNAYDASQPVAVPTLPTTPPFITDAVGDPGAACEDAWCFQPCYWCGPVWEGSVELGVNGADGNNEAFSFQTGGEWKRKCKTHELSIDVTYVKTTADSQTTQHNSLSKLRLDRFFDSLPWTLFVISNGIYDELKPFDFRVAVNGGLGYRFIKNDFTTLTGRVGSGFSHEIGGPDDRYVPEADFGADFEHRMSKRQKLVFTVDYYPDWEDFDDYRILSDLGWEFLLDAATNLSLKISVIDRYDSTPNGAKHNDVNYSILLLWKL